MNWKWRYACQSRLCPGALALLNVAVSGCSWIVRTVFHSNRTISKVFLQSRFGCIGNLSDPSISISENTAVQRPIKYKCHTSCSGSIFSVINLLQRQTFFSYFAYNVTVWGLPPLIDLLFLFLTQPQIVQWVLCNKCITMQCLRCCYLNYKLHVNNCILHINKKTAMATKLQNSYSWYVQFLQIISNTTTQTVPLSYLLSTKLFPFPDNKTPYLCKNGINNLHNNCACAAFAGYIVTFPCLFISKFKLVFTWA